MKKRFFLYTACAAMLALSCNKHQAYLRMQCDASISYKQTVQQVFIHNCTNTGCHDGATMPYLGEYQLTKENAAEIYQAVKLGSMPRDTFLSAADKEAILCWIDNGAADN